MITNQRKRDEGEGEGESEGEGVGVGEGVGEDDAYQCELLSRLWLCILSIVCGNKYLDLV